MAKFELSDIQVTGASGLDALFQQSPELVTPRHRRRVASLRDLTGFVRVSAETLIHKSQQDLWALKREADGQYFIERLFNGDQPVKG